MNWRDLKNNPNLREIFEKRAEVTAAIRAFFQKEGFLQVFTSVMATSLIPESYLEVFETELRDKEGNKKRMFLIPSPEIWHKKLLVAGSGNIFEITKSFRNTDCGGRFHHPEFTMLEWYRVNCDYRQAMKDCERLIQYLINNSDRHPEFISGSDCKKIKKMPKRVRHDGLIYQGKTIDISKSFERMTVAEAFEKYAGILKEALFNPKQFNNLAIQQYSNPSLIDDYETAFSLVYVDKIEPNLGWERPTIIYDYPAQFAPLSKTSKSDKRVKERFELYVGGVEIADGCTELTDAAKQKKEFIKEITKRKKAGKVSFPTDWDFISALKSGLPPCAGVALGIDRLLMVLLDKKDIREVMMES